jgi:hypothetical protein
MEVGMGRGADVLINSLDYFFFLFSRKVSRLIKLTGKHKDTRGYYVCPAAVTLASKC